MRSRVTVATLGSLLLTASLAVPSAAAHHPTDSPTAPGTGSSRTARACDSVSTRPTFRGKVPSPSQFLGYDLGRRKATNAQVEGYLKAVDRASREVVTGTFGKTGTGASLRYALVGRQSRLSPSRLQRVRDDLTRLQDPATPAEEARRITARTPVVIWLMGSVHGNEPAATDAQLRVLHELADRSDCVSSRILNNAIVGIVPLQNPDGRHRNTRASAAAFDLNRDWFARTQPETRAKVELLRSLPPQVVIDEHGMGGKGYFFPPNSDPTFHEVAAGPLSTIDDVFGRANAAAFTALRLSFETYEAGFDLFYPGYGDTFPLLALGAAGMTYEVGQEVPLADQVRKHYVAAMASLFAGAGQRRPILDRYHAQWGEALQQGRECLLQPNRVDNPGKTVQFTAPQRRVCGYFLRPEAGRGRELARTVANLQEDGVVVHRLDAPLVVDDYTPYGRPSAPTTLPAGTYWVSSAQPRKHWIQAMLGENTHVPFPYFYDVSGWNAPMRADVAGGYTGRKPVNARMSVVPRVRVPQQAAPASPPSVAVLTHSPRATNPNQSTGWLTWRLEKDWRLPSTTMLPTQLDAAALKDVDVLLVPDLDAKALTGQLGVPGTAALKAWVAGGGHLVAWRGGARFAAASGLTTTVLRDPKQAVPGVLIRAKAGANTPLTGTVGDEVWPLYNSDPIMTPAAPANALLTYPTAGSSDWYVSGFAQGADEVAGTAAATSERLGTGTVTLYAFEPNFRGFTDGTASLVLDAILASRGTIPARGPQAAASQLAVRRSAAARAGDQLAQPTPDSRTDTRPARS